MLTISLLLISVCFVYSPIRPIVYFSQINCYESFSKPKLYLPLHIHSYTGPKFIKVHIKLDIQITKNFDVRMGYWNKILYFKKVYGFCEHSNITFSANFIDDYKLFIFIKIYLPKETKELSYTAYTFEKGFQSDKYMLIDEFGNFAISATIIDSKERYPREVVGDDDEAFMYLRTLKYENNHICFVTNNNQNNVIKPYFHGENKEKGYIISITVKVNSEILYNPYNLYEYPAFECYSPQRYNKETYFIFDNGDILYFFANTIKLNDDNQLIGQAESFSTRKTSNRLTKTMIYTRSLNLIFLMKEHYITCKDGSLRKVYKSINGTVLYAHYAFHLQVKPHIERREWLIYDPFNPCE